MSRLRGWGAGILFLSRKDLSCESVQLRGIRQQWGLDHVELRIPIKNPILDRMIRFRGRVGTVRPVTLDGTDQAILIRVRGLFGIGPFGLEVRLKLWSIPFLVRCSNLIIPVLLD